MKANNHNCKLQGTSITYNNRVYHYKDLNKLPEGSKLEDAKLIPRSDGKGLCFQGELCFVSNFYTSPLIHQGIPSLSVEQAFQWDIAVNSGDLASAGEIINSTDRLTAKRLGSEITPTEAWAANEENLLKQIALLKFKQNDHLAKRLRDSPYEHIL